MRQMLTSVTLMGVLMLSTLNVWATSAKDAEALIKTTTADVLEALKADSSKAHSLVENVVLSHFDFRKMSRLVLGKHWRKANRNQKTRFSDEFRYLLINTYSTALVEAAGKVEKIDYLSKDTGMMGKKKPKPTASVSAKVYQKGKSSPIEVDYSMYFQPKKEKWKVYNLSVGGVSLVTNYRKEFSGKIKAKKIKGLIKEMRCNRLDNKSKECQK
ncbi:ABC transporter substrate-binding protein [Candidatus Parabeggiatoa sp. HSG14]|uniref:MlaC/ttg2D family ABC transporter substrate-binding protein n=1 Tax=Candidatus Parabeggiatoa sp. HSG14 TaxID=3055593 RepID=UPI0025A8915A|nr:ABC transporter substrate-binding protein [Thiotrichales bacterium HSG14]